MIRRAAPPEVWRASGFVTQAPPAAQARRSGLRRWGLLGAVLGALGGVLAFAPAAWLAAATARGSEQRLLLAEARGTVWSGSAVPVLTGGAGSRSAAVLPGRLHWRLGWHAGALELRLRQACCLNDAPRLRLTPGLQRQQLELLADVDLTAAPAPATGAPPPVVGQWPADWLAGLGTPWNTVQLDGLLRLATPGLRFERDRGQWRIAGSAVLDGIDIASRLSTLPTLGSYRIRLDGAGPDADGVRLVLGTTAGALRLRANGGWTGDGLRLRGEAEAAPGAESALDNLLNLIGRRQGARSLIAIG
ncbi:MAG: type II secretion system protein N [Rubrivivax sp.]